MGRGRADRTLSLVRRQQRACSTRAERARPRLPTSRRGPAEIAASATTLRDDAHDVVDRKIDAAAHCCRPWHRSRSSAARSSGSSWRMTSSSALTSLTSSRRHRPGLFPGWVERPRAAQMSRLRPSCQTCTAKVRVVIRSGVVRGGGFSDGRQSRVIGAGTRAGRVGAMGRRPSVSARRASNAACQEGLSSGFTAHCACSRGLPGTW